MLLNGRPAGGILHQSSWIRVLFEIWVPRGASVTDTSICYSQLDGGYVMICLWYVCFELLWRIHKRIHKPINIIKHPHSCTIKTPHLQVSACKLPLVIDLTSAAGNARHDSWWMSCSAYWTCRRNFPGCQGTQTVNVNELENHHFFMGKSTIYVMRFSIALNIN